MVYAAAVPAVDPVLVHHTREGVLYMDFPEISVVDFLHGEFLPAAKFPDETDSGSGRGKGAERGSVILHMGAQVFVRIKNFPCIKSVKIHN